MIFGTRPEIIKLSPVFNALRNKSSAQVSCIFSGQQADLAPEFLTEFNIPISRELGVMRTEQTLPRLMSRLIEALDESFAIDKPHAVIVQGDTSTALAGAMVASLSKIPVFHVEAGLRTFNTNSPFPEETNRRLIAKLANHHLAPTPGNRDNLVAEGVPMAEVTVTGNPIVDVVLQMKRDEKLSSTVSKILGQVQTAKFIVLTAHRRENFDTLLAQYLDVLGYHLEQHPELTIVAPVHPNPVAKKLLTEKFDNHQRVMLIDPLGYRDFLTLMEHATLVVSDSGGIQEEAVSLGCPLVILRETTERPEALTCGTVKLAPSANVLENLLNEFFANGARTHHRTNHENPFGDGRAGLRIANCVIDALDNKRHTQP